ncbi:methylated-DNA--[protein]-cysteine S-methyltransferase [Sedimenticola selenatireducens]|uniref:methylated-DNA--[protein]-cysteine S-methyltransferase n=1 Tax=Sedimenticola selenatireducens TaxID=191960 RepID=UPI0004921014|nr:methylated-DNA--[protein]-cysteine S-methyltransferase [Sedimenticola selenatireducens]
MKYDYYNSPIGSLLLAGDDSGLRFIGFPEGKGHLEPAADWIRDGQPFATVKAQLAEYFSGDRTEFDLPLHPHGTAFQLHVLQALQSIPYGETRSYSDIAQQIGKPTAVRAVGAANGRNPLPIVIPCHRVIGANGSLTGFGGGIRAKRFLLALEQQSHDCKGSVES